VAAASRRLANWQHLSTVPVGAGPSAASAQPIPASLWALAALHVVLSVYGAFLAMVAPFVVSEPERAYALFGLVEVPRGWPDAVCTAAYAIVCGGTGIGLARGSRYAWWLALTLWIERIPGVMRTLGTAEYSAWLLAALSLPVVLWLLVVRRYCLRKPGDATQVIA